MLSKNRRTNWKQRFKRELTVGHVDRCLSKSRSVCNSTDQPQCGGHLVDICGLVVPEFASFGNNSFVRKSKIAAVWITIVVELCTSLLW